MARIADESEFLHAYLADRDVACPQCDYNLRNLVGTRCPECGEAVALRVSAVEPKQAAPIAGLILLSAATGLNGLLLIYAAIDLMRRNRATEIDRFITVNLIEFAVVGACVVVWLKNWRTIRRLSAWRRWTLVTACGMLALADIIFFAKLID